MTRLYQSILALIILLPLPTSAHVKWFVNQATQAEPPFKLTEPAIITWIIAVIVITVIAFVLDKQLKVLPTLADFAKQYQAVIYQVVCSLLAGWLVLNTIDSVVFIPVNVVNTATSSVLLLIIQAVIAVLLVFPKTRQLAGGLLILLYLITLWQFGWDNLEHIFIIGLGLWLIIKNQQQGMGWLRLFTGTSLIILAFTEKLLRPDLAATFLNDHNWNFMQQLGLSWFDNRWFIASAGSTEALFGLILVLGVVTRLNTLVMSVFFFSTAVILGFHEVIGHLPIFAIGIILILYGAGERWLFKKTY
jgi:hypothetical protein